MTTNLARGGKDKSKSNDRSISALGNSMPARNRSDIAGLNIVPYLHLKDLSKANDEEVPVHSSSYAGISSDDFDLAIGDGILQPMLTTGILLE